ncbi:MAG: glycosyltransferase family 4 protein, partial [Campylobacterales bacterium]|nr:glycosyltransferase family 4 protein [Campylobacterales bacterium]
MLINFVMSSYAQSSIFEHIIGYFRRYGKFHYIVTKDAVSGADVYYYFRPHLETKLQKNSIVTVHHDLNEKDDALCIERFIPRYKEASIVVCLNSVQRDILNSYGITSTVVIPHGFNHEILYPIEKRLSNKKTLGYFSHYYPRNVKGEPYFIELLKKLNPEKYKIILVGEKRLLLGEDIRKLGYECDTYEVLPYSCYNDLYSMIDALIITSAYEGGPANIPEALATHTPIIATKVGMIFDLIGWEGLTLLTGEIGKDIESISSSLEKSIPLLPVSETKFNFKFMNWMQVINQYDNLFSKTVIQHNYVVKKNSWDIFTKELVYFYRTL